MATIKNRHNPSYVLFPVNNPRTAWRPFGLPVILVVPHRRSTSGTPLANSSVFNVRIYIENVPTVARVAGHDHIGQRFPDKEIYSENIDSLELAERFIDLNDVIILRDGVQIPLTEAEEGDLIQHTTRTGVTDTLEFYPDADYYDLSDFLIEVETLPSDRYNLIYETESFTRATTNDGLDEFLCINASSISIGRFEFELNHPGEVIDEFYTHTPPPYLTNATRALDTTVGLYQPFTDILQDVYDEQILLERVNWVFDVPAEAIPYLSSLLGWEIPYFPQSLDALRRAVLRRTVEFQSLKGSRRAIINIFRLFGFEILISNLWWSSDGKRFIRPGETLPATYTDQEIDLVELCQVDLLFDDYNTIGFSQLAVPLVFRAQEQAGFDNFTAVHEGGDITIEAYRVEQGTDAYVALQGIAEDIQEDPATYGSQFGTCSIDANGFQSHSTINEAMAGHDVVGFSQILISGKLGNPTDEIQVGENPPLLAETVNFNRETNEVHLTLNGYIPESTTTIFAFVIYKRQDIIVPKVLEDLQSNRFDLQVLTDGLEGFADPTTLDFALEFLFRLKAFHSLLNVIRTSIELGESYEVTDWCVGGDTQQRYDIDAGMLQVPPAIIPGIPSDINDCTALDPISLGYKPEDIELRNRKLASLPEEFAAYKALDDRQALINTAARLAPLFAAANRTECLYTHHGQDRIKIQERVESRETEYGPNPNAAQQISGLTKNPRLSPVDDAVAGTFNTTGVETTSNSNSAAYGSFTKEFTEVREALCETDGSDYCYKGRVEDELLYRPTILQPEHPRCKPCSIGLGVGVFYKFPAYSERSVPGTVKPCVPSQTEKSLFTGQAPTETITWYQDGVQGDYLTAPYDQKLPKKNESWMGQLYRGYGTPQDETLHYWNNVVMPSGDQRFNLALQRPSLEIDKSNLHIPGTRFVTLNALENDFTHPDHEARPWDDPYSTVCGPAQCAPGPTYLNCVIEIDGTTGNEVLVFDEVDYAVEGNGLIPDIWDLGPGSAVAPLDLPYDENDIAHTIFSEGADDSPYVTLDQLCDFDNGPRYGDVPIENGIANLTLSRVTNSVSKLIFPYEPVFSSYNDECLPEVFDFADGYACDRAYFRGSLPLYSIEDYREVLTCLGLTGMISIADTRGVYFTLGSGILIEDGLRLDCGCLLLGCGDTVPGTEGLHAEEGICSTDLFIDQDGEYDFNCDHLEIERNLTLEEPIGTCSTILDGTIPTLLELV